MVYKAKRLNQHFYMIDGYKLEKIPPEEKEKLKDDPNWNTKDRWFVKKSLPNGRLYAGWSFAHPTKITKEDLSDDFVLLENYKKHGYIRTGGIKSLIYRPSVFHNHAFKDDFLYISYSKNLGEYKEGYDEGSTYKECDEYIFGSDIINFIVSVDKYSPNIDTSDIKKRMVEQYNLYCDEMNERSSQKVKKINSFEELL